MLAFLRGRVLGPLSLQARGRAPDRRPADRDQRSGARARDARRRWPPRTPRPPAPPPCARRPRCIARCAMRPPRPALSAARRRRWRPRHTWTRWSGSNGEGSTARHDDVGGAGGGGRARRGRIAASGLPAPLRSLVAPQRGTADPGAAALRDRSRGRVQPRGGQARRAIRDALPRAGRAEDVAPPARHERGRHPFRARRGAGAGPGSASTSARAESKTRGS